MSSKKASPVNEKVRLRIKNRYGKELKGLDLSYCSLYEIPEEVFQLKDLQILDLSSNHLSQLPPEIGKMENLVVLDLMSNHLSQLPPEIENMTNLEVLDLRSNQLSHLPPEIGKMGNLRNLFLSSNKLSRLPPEIWKLKKLDELILKENPNLNSPPPSVVKQGLRAIQNYLEDLTQKTLVWTSKMVIVGEGGVGKTCLLDAIEGQEFVPGSDTTHGIEIRTWHFPHKDKKDVKMELQVWDFGGQDIYHATHQFYLTNHSLFFLVWSARAGYEAGKIYKWLETIRALAPDSPIFIIATHCKDRGADLPKGDLLKLYPGKLQFFEVDNQDKRGVSLLRISLRNTTVTLKYMGIERPLNWVTATQTVRKLDKKCLTKKELFQIFQNSSVNPESYESLAIYLHELGHILYYPDERDLRDTIIIKPAWVSQHIARILDNPELSENGGFLPKPLMEELWHDLKPYWHDKFITLMEKFDLAYRTDISAAHTQDPEAVCLVVEKLKYEEHPLYNDAWEQCKGQREITFKYVLDTIPAGIPTWFIARTHRFSQSIHWRHGALLKDKEKQHTGLIIARPEQKEVWLSVRGPMPYYFFAQLRDTVEFTFSRFEGLGCTTYVPCPGHDGEPCSHFFDLEQHLEKRLTMQNPRSKIECPIGVEDVNVLEMLFGLSFAPHNSRLVSQITRTIEHQLDIQTHQLVENIQTQKRELAKFIQLEFLKGYHRSQEIMDQTCPNMFTLGPPKMPLHKKALETDEYELQLYCQMPGCLHPVEKGKYNVKIPKQWLIKIAPYFNKTLRLLKRIVPILIPGAQAVMDDTLFNGIKASMGVLIDYIGKLEPISLHKNLASDSHFSTLRTVEGSELRNLRQFLEAVDKDQHWGGLCRFVTPEGHILWLCPEHIKEYK